MKKENLVEVLLLVVILVLMVFVNVKNVSKQNEIVVSGVASEFVKPDVATITIGVTTQGATVNEALTENNSKIEKVISAIVKTGVLSENIQTSNFGVSPNYDYNKQPPLLKGYTVEHDLNIKTKSEMISSVISAASSNGATNFYNVTFSVSNEEDLKQKLLNAAIDNAKAKANILASSIGKKIVEVKSISYDLPQLQTGSFPNYGIGAGDVAPQVRSGQNEVKVTVYVVYSVK